MAKFIIQGGNEIGGTFSPRGNKNAVLPMLAASVLTDQPIALSNVPDIQDVRVMLELLESLGVTRRGFEGGRQVGVFGSEGISPLRPIERPRLVGEFLKA